MGVGRPHLLAVDDEVVTVQYGAGREAREVRAPRWGSLIPMHQTVSPRIAAGTSSALRGCAETRAASARRSRTRGSAPSAGTPRRAISSRYTSVWTGVALRPAELGRVAGDHPTVVEQRRPASSRAAHCGIRVPSPPPRRTLAREVRARTAPPRAVRTRRGTRGARRGTPSSSSPHAKCTRRSGQPSTAGMNGGTPVSASPISAGAGSPRSSRASRPRPRSPRSSVASPAASGSGRPAP